MGVLSLRFLLLCDLACQWVETTHSESVFQQNFCTRRFEVQNGTRSRSLALEGLTLHVAITFFDNDFITFDPATGKYDGYLDKVMQAVATKGQFSYRYYDVPLLSGQSFTSWLFEVVQLYDLTGVYFAETMERVKNGTVSPYPFLDTSMFFYARTDGVEDGILDHIFAFTRPFKPGVWLLFMTIGLATAVSYAVFEHGHNDDDEMNTGFVRMSLGNAVYLTFFQMTMGGGYAPKTKAGKVLAVSWAWSVFLFTSAYTGSIASMLFARTQGRFETFEKFVANGHSLCTWGAGADFMKRRHPDYSNLVLTSSNPINDLSAGKCEAALVEKFYVDMARDNKDLNPHCNFEPVGHSVVPASGGWMLYSAYDRCSYVVRQAMELLFLQLKSEGMLEELYTSLIAGKADRELSCEAKKNALDAAEKLSLYQMSGTFYIHALLAGSSVVLFVIRLARRKVVEDAEYLEVVAEKSLVGMHVKEEIKCLEAFASVHSHEQPKSRSSQQVGVTEVHEVNEPILSDESADVNASPRCPIVVELDDKIDKPPLNFHAFLKSGPVNNAARPDGNQYDI